MEAQRESNMVGTWRDMSAGLGLDGEKAERERWEDSERVIEKLEKREMEDSKRES